MNVQSAAHVTSDLFTPSAGVLAVSRNSDRGRVEKLKKRYLEEVSDSFRPEPVPLKKLKPSQTPFLDRYVSVVGLGKINGNPQIVKKHLETQHNITPGRPTDQKHSGRCWIFGILNKMKIEMLEKYGKDFQYSQNYVAYWDKFERANFYLEKMIEMKDLEPGDHRLLHMIDYLYKDGGEWELFVNVVEKYGVVPDYAMPETEFSGNSGGYMSLLQDRLNEVGGILHRMARDGATLEELRSVKNRCLEEVRGVLNKYLGEPPQSFLWKPKGEKAKKIDPVEFYRENPLNLKEMVHLVHLPYRRSGELIEVRDVGNVVGGAPMRGLNVPLSVMKEAVRKSIQDNQSVPCGAEVKHLDREKKVFTTDADQKEKLFGFDQSLKLSKGDRLLYRATTVAHLMNFIGCDDPGTKRFEGEDVEGVPETLTQPLWKVENSWKDNEEIFMTDAWFDEYMYDVIVHEKYLPEEYRQLWKRSLVEEVDAWDPFGRI